MAAARFIAAKCAQRQARGVDRAGRNHRRDGVPSANYPIRFGEFVMRRIAQARRFALSGALVATAACTTDPYTGQRTINRTAVGILGGAVGGYLLGDLVGGRPRPQREDHRRRHRRDRRRRGRRLYGPAGSRASPPDRRHRRRRHPPGRRPHPAHAVGRSPSPSTATTIQPQFQRDARPGRADADAAITRPISTFSATPIRPAPTPITRPCRSGAPIGRRLSGVARRRPRPDRDPRLWRDGADRVQRRPRKAARQPPGRDQDRAGHQPAL